MLKKFSFILVMFVLAGVLVVNSSKAEIATNAMAPDFTLVDSNGKSHSLSDYKGKYVVLEWVNYQCPFVVKHYRSGNMQKTQKEMMDKGVVWLSINSSAKGKQGNYGPAEINQIMANSNANPTAYLIDESGKVGKQFGAKTTPHMFVVNPEGNLIYQGAVDSVPSFDPEDVKGATNYVVQALNQSLANSAVSDATTKPYGCSVKY